jgi:hypothetical protein
MVPIPAASFLSLSELVFRTFMTCFEIQFIIWKIEIISLFCHRIYNSSIYEYEGNFDNWYFLGSFSYDRKWGLMWA